MSGHGNSGVLKTRPECAALDGVDPLASKRTAFILPDDVIYLDGNSLGPLPRAAVARVAGAVSLEWGQSLIRAWNQHGWFAQPQKLGDKIARIIGADKGNVIVCDTISVNMFKLLSAAVALRPGRTVILSDTGNFPSDIYVAQELSRALGRSLEVRVVAPEALIGAIDEKTAVVMATEVDYRTARRHDMPALTKAAHAAGALAIWDLAHSAGAVPVGVGPGQADFAVGCTYKYLNGGPGAPAFIYVKPELQNEARAALAGWWGHAAPFAFELDYRPAPGVVRMQCGTQPILSLAALESALEIWDDVDLNVLLAKSRALCSLFIEQVEARCSRFGLKLAGPRTMETRGSHVSFQCDEGYALMQALIAHGVIGDFRSPDMVRFGFAPLYNTYVEVFDAAAKLEHILENKIHHQPEFQQRNAVT